jgi:hypothetical protein
VGLGLDEEVVGEGSTQIKPNHSFEVQVVLELVDEGIDEVEEGFAVVEVGSLQPNQPGVLHVLELEIELDVAVREEVVVTVGQGAALEDVVCVCEVVVVGSLHPNQPGVSQVDVEVEVVLVDVTLVVVDSSKQPHQPGVLQVSVLVLVAEVEVGTLLVVVLSVPLLSKNFQRTQSVQSVSSSHSGTVSYFSMTSLITLTILCVKTLFRQPRSPTVSYMHVLPV